MGGGGSKTTTSTQSNTPWAPQGAQLEYMLQEARNFYDTSRANGPTWTGSSYAGMDPTTAQALGIAQDIAQGPARAVAGTIRDTGTSLVGSGAAFGSNAAGFASGAGLDPVTARALGLEGALGTYATTGMGAQGAGIDATRQAATRAGSDRTGTIIDAAGRFADNPHLTGQIDAVNRDVARTLGEDTLPTLNRQASLGGGLNSSRAGAAEAIAVRGAQDRAADTAATMRGNAWSQGLTTAAEMDQFGTNALLAAGGQLGSFASSGAGVADGLSSLWEQRRQADNAARMAGNDQLGQALALGGDMAQAGVNMDLGAASTLAGVGAARQAEAQAVLDDRIEQAGRQSAFDWGNLSQAGAFFTDPTFANRGTDTRMATERTNDGGAGWVRTALSAASLAAAPFTGGASLAASTGGQFSLGKAAGRLFSSDFGGPKTAVG